MLRDFKWVIIVLVALAAMIVAMPMSSAVSADKVIITPDYSDSSYVYQGVTNYHYYYVDPMNDYIYVDLYWGNTANQLKITIKRPDGSTYGTFYDSSDGSTNGRIGLRIDNPGSGTWVFLVNGLKVTPTGQGYNLFVG